MKIKITKTKRHKTQIKRISRRTENTQFKPINLTDTFYSDNGDEKLRKIKIDMKQLDYKLKQGKT